MNTRSIVMLSLTLAALLTALVVAIRLPPGRAGSRPGAGVAARGFTLASTAVALPIDDARFPDAPHADAINANCAGCHSVSMVLDQPPLSDEQWKAEITKMREVYKAPVAEADVPAILAYLNATSARLRRARGN